MVDRHNSSRGRGTGGNPAQETAGSGQNYAQVSSQLHGATQDVTELLDLLAAGVTADRDTHSGTGASTGAGAGARGTAGDADAGEPGEPPRCNDSGDPR